MKCLSACQMHRTHQLGASVVFAWEESMKRGHSGTLTETPGPPRAGTGRVGIAASTSSGRTSRARQSHFHAALCVLRGKSRMEGTGAHENDAPVPVPRLGRTTRSGSAPRAPARKTSTPPPRCDEHPLQPNVRFAFSAAVSCREVSLIARSSPPCLPGVCTERRPRGPLQFQERGWSAINDCPGPPARLLNLVGAISVLCSKSSLHGAFCMGAQERSATPTAAGFRQ